MLNLVNSVSQLQLHEQKKLLDEEMEALKEAKEGLDAKRAE